MEKTRDKIDWLGIARGITIILVLTHHTQLVDKSTGECFEFCTTIGNLCVPFRMALFIFISGGLLYLSRICKNWSVKDLYIDKAKRLLIPFVFFVTVYYIMKVVFSGFVKTQSDFTIRFYLESFVYYKEHPSFTLWFLSTLSTFMLMYPLFRFLCRKVIYMCGFLVFCIAFYFVDLFEYVPNVFNLAKINLYLVFFFSGIFFFRYNLYKYLDSYIALIASTAVYVLSYYYLGENIIASFSGIFMMCSLSQILARYVPNLFSSFRDNIYQIYLMSMIFQGFVELVLWKKLFYNEDLVLFFYVLNILSGIIFPMLVVKVVEKCPVKIVRMCFGLK